MSPTGVKSIFEKLHFRDGLVWTVGLTVEINLRLQNSPVWCKHHLRVSPCKLHPSSPTEIGFLFLIRHEN